MKLTFILFTLIVAVFLFSAAGAEEMQGVTYTITPSGETDEYKILLNTENIGVGGLCIKLPGDFSITDTNAAEGTYKSEGTTLIVALTGEKELYFIIVSPDMKIGDLSISWEDLAKGTAGGEKNQLKDADELSQVSGSTTDGNSVKQSPSLFCGIFVIFLLIIAALKSRNSKEGEF